jgi:hypothetical protein
MIEIMKDPLLKVEIDKQIEEIFSSVSEDVIVKTASTDTSDDDDDIKEDRVTFISKEIKDPHYEAYVSQAKIKKSGKSMRMVSYYVKENYLGRYLIKRNYYFYDKNKKEANNAYDILIDNTKKIRKKYYQEEIMSANIPQETQNLSNSMQGDFTFDSEDTLGTTVSRNHLNGSAVYDWFYRNKEKIDEIRYRDDMEITANAEDFDDIRLGWRI